MPQITLTPAERRRLRARAHHVDPVVLIGSEGLTAAVLAEADAALRVHGLIKVRVFGDDRAARARMLARIADQLGAAPVQHIGKLLVLWRPPADAPAPGHAGRADEPPRIDPAGPRAPRLRKVGEPGRRRVADAGALGGAGRKRPPNLRKSAGR
jgi:putative YhbY family RNA-binding protein